MRKKRGQELPLNTIIIAIIVITVLVVLIVVFTGGIGRFTGGLEDCEVQGGTCDYSECPAGYSKTPLAKCGGGNVCCIKVEGVECRPGDTKREGSCETTDCFVGEWEYTCVNNKWKKGDCKIKSPAASLCESGHACYNGVCI